MKALIFGANGQDGFYLRELLARENVRAVGVSRRQSELTDVCGDVADFPFVAGIIKELQPDFVFHLAANSTTNHSALFDNHQAISTGALNILESVKLYSARTKVFLSGSAVQFENTGAPIDEQTTFAALSPYAVSRIHTVYAARYYRSLGIAAYVGYFFNHDSPRRSVRHVNQKIAQAAKRIAAGSREILEIGDATVKKEFNFAGDAVAAAWVLINQNQVFEAVIGSGAAHSIAEWLELCFAHGGLDWKNHVTIKSDFKPEYQILISNPALLKSLGWQPRVNISELAKMMIEER